MLSLRAIPHGGLIAFPDERLSAPDGHRTLAARHNQSRERRAGCSASTGLTAQRRLLSPGCLEGATPGAKPQSVLQAPCLAAGLQLVLQAPCLAAKPQSALQAPRLAAKLQPVLGLRRPSGSPNSSGLTPTTHDRSAAPPRHNDATEPPATHTATRATPPNRNSQRQPKRAARLTGTHPSTTKADDPPDKPDEPEKQNLSPAQPPGTAVHARRRRDAPAPAATRHQ